MLSVAAVRSASGAANYFAKDDYYTVEGSSEISAWAGEGADSLGLAGEVAKDAFEGILNGILPDGEAVAQVENRRAGFDLTFSMPKRSEEHTSELQSLMRISYAVFCLKKKTTRPTT